MKRSGNHAILQWLMAQDRFVFLNNVCPILPVLEQKPIPPVVEFAAWQNREIHAGGTWLQRKIRSLKQRNHILCASLEDRELHVRPFTAEPRNIEHILIIRDPVNFLASRIRKSALLDSAAYPSKPGPLMDRVLDVWKQHAREFLGDTRQLEPATKIYFNRWFADQSYRKRISAQLGLRFTDQGFSQVSDTGGGSSFDATHYDGRNSEMQVLSRAQLLAPDEKRFLDSLLQDPEILELARRIELVA